MTIMTLATACSFRWTRFKFTRSSRAFASTVIGAVNMLGMGGLFSRRSRV